MAQSSIIYYVEQINLDLLGRLGISTLRPAQESVILRLTESDDDLLAVMPTGYGKTLCFMYASLVGNGLTVIIYPLVSLMNDQKRRFDNAGISSVILKGGQTKSQRAEIFDSVAAGNAKVVITNPETLELPAVLQKLSRCAVSLFVIDEAHTIVEWGRSFRSALLDVRHVIDVLHPAKIAAFTATASPEVIDGLSDVVFAGRDFAIIRYSSDRPNIVYKSILTSSRSFTLLETVKKSAKPILVFANNRVMTELISDFVGKYIPGQDCRCYHAGLPADLKKETEKWFSASADGILVATCAYGMGVDKGNIRTVIHFLPPDNVSSFLQESGRAGRDGMAATSFVIMKRSDIEHCRNEKRKKILDIFAGDCCIRKTLLSQMGEDVTSLACSGCSVCNREQYDDRLKRTIEGFRRFTHNSYYENETVLILKGVNITGGLLVETLPHFGALKDYQTRFIAEAVKEI